MSQFAENVVFYHGDKCVDGFTAAWIAHSVLGDRAEYIPLSYENSQQVSEDQEFSKLVNAPTKPSNGDTVFFFLDFAPRPEIAERLAKLGARVIIRDHHKSAFEQYSRNGTATDIVEHEDYRLSVYLHKHKSGAMLAWEHFRNGPAPRLVEYVQDRDLWQWKLLSSREYNAALRSYPQDFETWDALCNILAENGNREHAREMLRAEGTALLRSVKQRVADLKQQARYVNLAGKVGLGVNGPADIASELGEALALEENTYGLVWRATGDGITVDCSLRSRGSVDVCEIAKHYGGGGHANSAGFSMRLPAFQYVWGEPISD